MDSMAKHPSPCPDLMSASMSVALPAILSLHLGQMHGERLDLGELMLVLWSPALWSPALFALLWIDRGMSMLSAV